MRKIKIICAMAIMLLLVGCASMDVITDDTNVYGNIEYNWSTMIFTDIDQADIFYQTGNSFVDFVILHQQVMEEPFIPAEGIAYLQLFTIMNQVIENSAVNYSMISGYTSAELKNVCNTYSIAITLADIITFNAYKSLIIEIKDTIGDNRFVISKLNYLELRLNRSLTNDEISSLVLLQEKFLDLNQHYVFVPLLEHSFDDLLLAFQNQIFYVPTEQELIKLEVAYHLINDLIVTLENTYIAF